MVARDPRARRRTRSCTTAPGPTWPAASPPRCAARRGGEGDTGLFEVDEFWLDQVVPELAARALLLGQPLPRPARPLRRARDDRRPLGAASWRARRRRARAQRRRPARRRPRPRPSDALYFGVEDHGWRWPRCSTPPTPSTAAAAAPPYVYDAVFLGHLGHYHCPNCDARAPGAAGRGARHRARRHPQRPLHAAHARRRRAPSRCRCPGLYNVYNALGAAALALALGAPLDDVVAGLQAVSPAFGRAETVRARRPRPVDPARQEPGRGQRGAAHAGARARRARRASPC